MDEQTLANAEAPRGLLALNLTANPTGAVGVRALVESPYFEKLERLHLRSMKLSQGEQEALRERFGERVSF